MINCVVLIGRLVADPDVRYTQSGIAVVNFTIAVERPFRNAAGEKETDFIDIVAWRKTAELVGKYMSKGRLVGIQGAIQARSYVDKNGNNRKAVEVVADSVQFLESKRSIEGGSYQGQGAPAAAPRNVSGPSQQMADDDYPPPPPEPNNTDADLPF